MTGASLRTLVWLFAFSVLCAPCSAEKAADISAVYNFHIDSQPLEDALQEFAGQSGMQIIFFSNLIDGRTAPAVHGRYTPTAALDRLLAQSGLTYRVINPTTIEIRAAKAPMKSQSEIASLGPDSASGPRVASASA
ncbi:MAG TPA: STN domain-containing protein [Steroidobacteraceae bacterium]|jgi:hypothetical protein|nr:STN domain-containing protein [Steroidobacteraceae bacterium]